MKTPLQAAHDLLHVMTEVGGVMARNYCKCGDNKGSCIDCAEEEIGRLTAQLAERDVEIAALKQVINQMQQEDV